MKIEGEVLFPVQDSLVDMDISLTIRREHMNAIVKAYIENGRLEDHFSRYGAIKFSPEYLAKAQLHRSVKETLFALIGLFSAGREDADYYLEMFKDDIHKLKIPDMSLILKPDSND